MIIFIDLCTKIKQKLMLKSISDEYKCAFNLSKAYLSKPKNKLLTK